MTDKDEPKMVAFKMWALKFGEDIDGKGGTVDIHAVEKSLHKLKDASIGLSFDLRKKVGTVLHLRQYPEGIEAEGIIREDLLSKGRPALAGKIEKADEKDERKILDWDLQECGWILAKDDPREKSKGVDPKRLKAAEDVCSIAIDLRDTENGLGESPSEDQLATVAKIKTKLDSAIAEWEKNL